MQSDGQSAVGTWEELPARGMRDPLIRIFLPPSHFRLEGAVSLASLVGIEQFNNNHPPAFVG